MRTILIAATLIIAPSAHGQEKVWTPAPVPSVAGGNTVMPAARAGERVGTDNTTPFSSVPSASVAAGGATSPNQTNDVGTPNVSK